MVESLAQLPPVAQPGWRAGPWRLPAYGLTAECSSFLFFLFFPSPSRAQQKQTFFMWQVSGPMMYDLLALLNGALCSRVSHVPPFY